MEKIAATCVAWFHTAFSALYDLPTGAKLPVDAIEPWEGQLLSLQTLLQGERGEEAALLQEFYAACARFFRGGLERKGGTREHFCVNLPALEKAVEQIDLLYGKLLPYFA